MSILSSITGRLPNLLETIQGTWTVEYRIQTDKTKQEPKGWLNKMGNFATSANDLLIAAGETYGLFPSTWQALDFTSFIEMNEIEDTTITSHPVEGGSFRSVNKVRKPKMIKVTIAKAGIGYGVMDSLAEIKGLLPLARYGATKGQTKNIGQALEAAWENSSIVSKTLFGDSNSITPKAKIVSIPMEFRVVTPFETIEHLNLIKLDYTFKQDTGRNMLVMYLTFQEIIERGSSSKTTNKTVKTPKNPTNFPKQNIGTISLQNTGSALDQAFNISSTLL